MASQFYIGWDVGGWNCDNNSRSRDALAVLDSELQLVATPWRGNLREAINRASDSDQWVEELACLCAAPQLRDAQKIVLAIDAPLGFSDALVSLAARMESVERIDESSTNPYLFRFTERFLFSKGLKPLSSIKDMIGSQATKARHVLSRVTPNNISCGVWTDSRRLTAIEAYPASCRGSAVIRELRDGLKWSASNQDMEDAVTCAYVASLFDRKVQELMQPEPTVSKSEGWIWVPKDSLA